MGALYLKPLDQVLSKLGEYRRYMDDWVVFTNNRQVLRCIDLSARRILKKLGMVIHPDKTFIGSSNKRFHFLGIQFEPKQLSLPRQRLLTIKNTVAAQRSALGKTRYLERIGTYSRSIERRIGAHIILPEVVSFLALK